MISARRALQAAVGLVALACLAPILAVLGYAGRELDLGELGELWFGESQREALWNTLWMATGTAVLSAVLGLGLACAVVRTDVPGARWFRRVFPLPFLVPPYVGALAWMNLAHEKVGWLNHWLGEGRLDIHSLGGMVWVLSSFFYSVVFLAVSAALEQVDSSLEESARTCGAGRWRVFWSITIPLVRPALLSSTVLVFAAAVAAFGVPALIGSPGRLWVLSTAVYQDLATGGLDGVPRAAGRSVLLLAIPLLLFLVSELVLRHQRHAVIGGKHGAGYRMSLGPARWLVLAGLLLAASILLALPFGAVLLASVARNLGDLGVEGWTLDRYRQMVDSRAQLRESLLRSGILAAAAASLCVALGAALAVVKVRGRGAWRGLPDLAAALPYAVPGTVVALGCILLWTAPLKLVHTPWILLFAYVVKYLAFPARTGAEALAQIDGSLEEAARVGGASPLRTFWSVSLPLLMPGLVAGWFLVFLPAFSELTMSVLLVAPGTQTIGTRLFHMQEYGEAAPAAALAVLVVVLVVVANGVLRWLTRGRFGL